MHRRSLLTALGAGVSALAGCSAAPGREDATPTGSAPATTTKAGGRTGGADSGDATPVVGADGPELAPGEFAMFDVAVERTTGFRFDPGLYGCGASDAPVTFGAVDTDPDPDRQADSCPPYWIWDDCTDVVVHVPVDVASDTDPGDYRYGFTVSDCSRRSTTRTYRGTITVTDT